MIRAFLVEHHHTAPGGPLGRPVPDDLDLTSSCCARRVRSAGARARAIAILVSGPAVGGREQSRKLGQCVLDAVLRGSGNSVRRSEVSVRYGGTSRVRRGRRRQAAGAERPRHCDGTIDCKCESGLAWPPSWPQMTAAGETVCVRRTPRRAPTDLMSIGYPTTKNLVMRRCPRCLIGTAGQSVVAAIPKPNHRGDDADRRERTCPARAQRFADPTSASIVGVSGPVEISSCHCCSVYDREAVAPVAEFAHENISSPVVVRTVLST
jgi:hypothetical protein